MKRSTTLFFWILGGYVLLQFAWWAYHLIELTQIGGQANKEIDRKTRMIASEGLVFLLIILIGLWRIRYSMKKEILFADRQQNFLLSVTHELKTPLASNKLMLQTLLKRKLDDDQRIDLLQKAITENVRLESMIDNILSATQIDHNSVTSHFNPFSITALVEKVTHRYEKTYHITGIEFKPTQEFEVLADVNMVESILTNLLDNSIKYGKSEPQISIDIVDKETTVSVEIQDNSGGIPEKMHKDIFKKFVRVGDENTRNKKGSGLGLYIAHEFALINKGKLILCNSDEKGSLFCLELKKV